MDDDPPPASRKPPPAALEVSVSSAVGRLPLARARVAQVARAVLAGEKCRSAVLAITFVGEREIARLHQRHLRVAGPTDIITFEHAPTVPGGPRVADIYIAPAVAGRNARDAGCGPREELARLTIHGVLHALGWTHPDGAGRLASPMWRRQERWLERLRAEGSW